MIVLGRVGIESLPVRDVYYSCLARDSGEVSNALITALVQSLPTPTTTK